jgi:hypothetical protein
VKLAPPGANAGKLVALISFCFMLLYNMTETTALTRNNIRWLLYISVRGPTTRLGIGYVAAGGAGRSHVKPIGSSS